MGRHTPVASSALLRRARSHRNTQDKRLTVRIPARSRIASARCTQHQGNRADTDRVRHKDNEKEDLLHEPDSSLNAVPPQTRYLNID